MAPATTGDATLVPDRDRQPPLQHKTAIIHNKSPITNGRDQILCTGYYYIWGENLLES